MKVKIYVNWDEGEILCADLLFMEEEERKLIEDCAVEYLAECVGKELDREFKEIELEV